MEKESSSSVKSNKFIQMTLTFLLSECCSNAARLFLRLFVGILMLTHGIAKIENFDTLVDTFPDPIGLGTLTLPLIILVEVGSFYFSYGRLSYPISFNPVDFLDDCRCFFDIPYIRFGYIRTSVDVFGNFYNAFISRSGKMFDRLSLGQGL